jgi:hypothetical protein
MRRIKYSAKRNQIKVRKSKFGKLNLENDVIHDALKVICNKNLKKNSAILGIFGDIGTFGNIGSGSI